MASKRTNYQGINLTKDVIYLHTENFKTKMNKLKKRQISGKISLLMKCKNCYC